MSVLRSFYNSKRYKKFIKTKANQITKLVKSRIIYDRDPYKEKFHERECIFIHIPKCAGISIEESILDGSKVGHKRLVSYKYYSPLIFKRYFVFTIVRNPIKRFESAFSYLKSGGRNDSDKKWAKEKLGSINSTDQLLERMRKNKKMEEDILSWIHFRPQVWYLKDYSGEIPVDYLGKIESIKKDFNKICKKLGISRNLSHKNRTQKSKKHIVKKGENKKYVKEIYHEDFEMLCY